ALGTALCDGGLRPRADHRRPAARRRDESPVLGGGRLRILLPEPDARLLGRLTHASRGFPVSDPTPDRGSRRRGAVHPGAPHLRCCVPRTGCSAHWRGPFAADAPGSGSPRASPSPSARSSLSPPPPPPPPPPSSRGHHPGR